VAPEWWRHLATPKSKAGSGAEHETKSETERDLTRDYYVVEAADGARFWMFREGRYGCGLGAEPPRWFLHGLFN
jgi:protein ImuB